MIRYLPYPVLLLVVVVLLSITVPTQATSVTVLESRPEDIGTHASMAIGIDGLPVIAYFDDSTKDLIYAKCIDSRCVTANVRKIDANGSVGKFLSVAIAPNGMAVLSYRHTNQTPEYNLRLIICNDVNCGGTETIPNPAPTFISIPATGDITDTSVTIGNDGFPIVAYGVTGGGLRLLKCNNAICDDRSDFPVPINGNPSVNHVNVAISTDEGTPVITYTADLKLSIVKCEIVTCQSIEREREILNTGDIVSYASMVLRGVLKHPIIAYKKADGLYVMECDDYLCINDNTTAENVKVNDNAAVGDYVSITIDTDGKPILAHYKSDTGDLLVTKCHFIDCNSNVNPPTPATTAITFEVDIFGNVGMYPAIATNFLLNQTMIAYYDFDAKDPKVAVFGNHAPQIMPVGVSNPIKPQTLMENGVLAFRIDVLDYDNSPANSISYAMEPISGQPFPDPLEATIDAQGFFRWDTFGDELEHSTYGFRLVVSDTFAQDTDNVIINVIEDNKAPDLTPIDSELINLGAPVAIRPVATDSDLPAQTLTFSIDPLPDGASFNPANGAFDWVPSNVGIYTFTMTVRDNGTPVQEVSDKFTITVGQSMIDNSGFEDRGISSAIPARWNGIRLNKDRRKCSDLENNQISYRGKCAFMFTGSIGENSALVQNVAADKVAQLEVGDTLAASVAVKSTATFNKLVVMSIKYNSGLLTEKIILDVTNAGDGETYQIFDNSNNLQSIAAFNGKVKKIKVKVQFKGTRGKVFIDAVNLLHMPAGAVRNK